MTADDPKPPATEIRECPRELVALVCALRPDWIETETWTAVLAAKTAGREWRLIAGRLVAIALRDDNPPSSPRDLWNDLRGLVDRAPGRGAGDYVDPAGQGGAEYLAAKAAIASRVTGPQPVLRDTGPLELLREGCDP